ncbi:MAG: hypothetical protein LC753_05115 [Acidobacteria bacterium]|nr:hypothetical protein [Acidobacteriota bacterium]MCA1649672.1 hypothetical protein [Acidobacteriota bacterium]
MSLQRQDAERGYAMAALLVALAVMSVLMSAALPVWRHQAIREKEAELVFRGEQYARAIGLYQKKNGPGTFPPSVDVLVQQRFLRKKFKDPITNDDFFLIQAGAPTAPGQTGSLAGGAQPPGSQPTRPGGPTATVTSSGGSTASATLVPSRVPDRGVEGGAGRPGQVQGGGGIMGVSSKSKDTSIRIYKGRTHYNEWTFLFANANARPGGPGNQRPGIPPGVRSPTAPGGIGGGLGGGGGGQPRPGAQGPGGRQNQPVIRPPGG